MNAQLPRRKKSRLDEFGFGGSKMTLWRFAAAQGKPLFAYVQLLYVLCVPVVASEMKTEKLTGIYLWDGVANVAYARKKKKNQMAWASCWPSSPEELLLLFLRWTPL